MGTNVTGKFHSREDADAVVERLVQEYGVNRADIFVAAAGTENSAGDERSGCGFRRRRTEPRRSR